MHGIGKLQKKLRREGLKLTKRKTGNETRGNETGNETVRRETQAGKIQRGTFQVEEVDSFKHLTQ